VTRQFALTLLIVSIAAVVQSDAQDRGAPRRLDPSASDLAVQPPAPSKQAGDPSTFRRDLESITERPFSYSDRAPQGAPAGRPAEAVELFHCDFGPRWDNNFDNWPDRWSREHSVDFPHYLQIRIADDPSPVANRSLRVDLNGGAAAIHTPPIRVDAMYTYVVEGYLRTQRLKHDEACLALTFLDANNKPLETIRSERLRRTTGWTKVRIGPVASASKRVQSAIVTLHLGPTCAAAHGFPISGWAGCRV
jgi:hypothetical protein